MKTISVTDIEAQFKKYLKQSEAEPIVVTRNGKAVAVILGVQDDDEIERLLFAHSPRSQAVLAESRKQIQEGDVLSHDEFWAEVKASRTSSSGRRKSKTTTKA